MQHPESYSKWGKELRSIIERLNTVLMGKHEIHIECIPSLYGIAYTTTAILRQRLTALLNLQGFCLRMLKRCASGGVEGAIKDKWQLWRTV